MRQIILIESYLGLSGFTYLSSCTGRKLDLNEVKALRLTDDAELDAYRKSDYDSEWYEINPNDRITIITNEEEFLFEIPHTPLPGIPQKLHVGIPALEMYLAEYCKRIT